jgi:hypothetical protein
MGDVQTVVRTEIRINGESYFLAQGQDRDEVKQRIEDAAPGTFVDFTVVGNRSVSVLISDPVQVVVMTEDVEFDTRDTGDIDAPYDEGFDVI